MPVLVIAGKCDWCRRAKPLDVEPPQTALLEKLLNLMWL